MLDNESNYWYSAEYVDKMLKKQDKEIERLTELCNKYEEEHNTTFEEWKKTINIINELALLFDDYMSFVEVLEKYNYKLKGSDK